MQWTRPKCVTSNKPLKLKSEYFLRTVKKFPKNGQKPNFFFKNYGVAINEKDSHNGVSRMKPLP